MDEDTNIQKIDLDKVDWRGSREFFESLTDELRSLDDKDESYDFTWVGKRKAVIEAGAPINKTLRPDVQASKNWSDTENLFIEGDNLDALKLLQESYLGKVKMIYIDPPYNTGKDFVYHDNFKANVEQYDEDTEYKDDDGNIQFKKNEKTNGRYHSDWLSMMYPRLKLARNLLRDDGVIFISIDDNEQANLKKLCDEVFGEDNFAGQFAWKTRQASGKQVASNNISVEHEYVLTYFRAESSSLNGVSRDRASYTNPDNDPRGDWAKHPLDVGSTAQERPNCFYTLTDPATGNEFPANPNRVWAFAPESMRKLIEEEKIIFDPNGKNRPALKKFWTDLKSTEKPISSWLSQDNFDISYNAEGTREVARLFESERYFDYPKPVSLIKLLATQGSDRESIILDFFSGSATTAHAVMQLNAEDGGNRKWIMVQLPEETDEKSEAYKAGYKTIPEISRERIRRAGDKIASEHPEAKVDYGFRALRIDETNHKDVYRPAADYQQNMLDSLVDNVKPDRSDLDLLYGVLTATAWELNKPLQTVELAGSTVYKYDYFGEVSGLVACFAPEISEETIKQIAQLRPLTAVFRESSFPDSQAKVNLAEHFRILSPDTKVKVI